MANKRPSFRVAAGDNAWGWYPSASSITFDLKVASDRRNAHMPSVFLEIFKNETFQTKMSKETTSNPPPEQPQPRQGGATQNVDQPASQGLFVVIAMSYTTNNKKVRTQPK
ncbi:unnamed protein product [Clonostachys chloroleuca]|uniref:Uncharacterized protein n=1 Tax=Clonostachys chloroleuca TaxID=1926264 RepID=A0AA35PU13_9HYPO|nr:unnamed protein product [Clonostachys chloroleuca]